MKNLSALLTTTFLCIYLAPLFAQFPPERAEWVVYHTLPIQGALDDYYVFRDIMPGDTQVYRGKVYKKIMRQKLCRCLCTNTSSYMPEFDQDIHTIGGIREEAGKVYFTRFWHNPSLTGYFYPFQDTLLFDFTVQLSDTVPYNDKTYIVTQINGSTITLRQLNNLDNRMDWHKIIGSVYGISAIMGFYFLTDACYSSAQPSTCTIPCTLNTAVAAPAEELGVKIIPGNTSGCFSLLLPENIEQVHCRVFSVDGRQVAEETALKNEVMITLPGATPGILFFHFQTDDGRSWVQKVQNIR